MGGAMLARNFNGPIIRSVVYDQGLYVINTIDPPRKVIERLPYRVLLIQARNLYDQFHLAIVPHLTRLFE